MVSVLVLDDQEQIRGLLTAVISAAGYEVLEAASGEAALELARRELPDLIVADILMPGMDGYEFVRELRRDSRIAATRVVFCTATYIEEDVQRLAASCGVEHVLVKPFGPDDIVEVVSRALSAGPVAHPGDLAAGEFDRAHRRVLNDRLIAKVDELEELNDRHQELTERLRSSELEYRLLFDSNPLPMLVYERATLRILAVNRALVGSYGYSPDELRSMTITDLLPPEDADALHTFLATHPGGVQPTVSGEVAGQTWRHTYRDGTVIDVEVTTANLTLDRRECRIAACVNVTERKRAADAIAAARDEAVEASRVKSAFLANMSHEIRTPMNGVIGMNDLLLGTALTGEQREYADEVARSSEHMMTLIDDMLDISRIEAARVELDDAEFDLRETIEHACAVADRQARAKGVELELAIAAEVPRVVNGDGARLRRVLLNLVTNAVKFTEEGRVAVTVAARPGGDGRTAIRCEVLDTGIGIDPAIVDRMFEAFTQADTSTTRRFGGTGLGLAIAKQLVELMGGSIGAESEPGRGSNFWFEVELAPPASSGGGSTDSRG